MALQHFVLVYNQTGQVVEFYPPDDELQRYGAPSAAATYSAWRGDDSDDGTAEFSGTASLDSVSTTVDQVSYATDLTTRIYLTSTSNITVGRRYLVENTLGRRKIVKVVAITSAGNVDVDVPVDIDLAVGSTFKGIRHTFTISSSWIQDSSNINVAGSPALGPTLESEGSGAPPVPYKLRWTYTTGDSVSRISWAEFDVVRKAFKTGVGINDIRPQIPDVVWQQWIQQRGENFDPQVAEALRLLEFDIRMAGYDPDAIVDPQVAVRLHVQRAICVIALAMDAGNSSISPFTKFQLETYQTMFQQSIGTGLKAWIDTGSTGAINPDPPRQLWLRGR